MRDQRSARTSSLLRVDARRTGAIGALCALACSATGCLLPMPCSSPGIPSFSPESTVTAWIRVDYLTEPLNFERSMSQSAYLHWCPTDKPEAVRSVRIAWVGSEFGGYHLGGLVHLVFSPDSHRIAVITPRSLQVFDIVDGHRWDAAADGEHVSSLAWLGNDEIGYAAHTSLRGRYRSMTDRAFWRQRIGDSAASRVLIRREEAVEAGFHSGNLFVCSNWPLEYWSPNGNYVLYKPSMFGGRLHVLDVRAGRARALGPEELYLERVAWKSDESAVACIAGIRGQVNRCAALLMEPQSLRTLDFTEPFLQSLPHPSPSEMAWACDGRYLLINDLWVGGCVIEPAPFRCIRVGECLPSRGETAIHQAGRYWSHIYPARVPGWMLVRSPDLNAFIADYECQTILPVGKILGEWSQNGRLAAVVGRDGRLRAQRIELPPLPMQPSTQQTSTP